ncbi:Protein CD4.3 [Aphelenchoides avenae]|nr:Protein CD4.3 [Aphelenchus avenae]
MSAPRYEDVLEMCTSTLMSQISSLPADKEMKLAQSKSQAEYNLSMEPKLKAAKERLATTYNEAEKIKSEVELLKAKLDSISENRSLDTVSVLLQAAAQDAEDKSERVAESFQNGEIDVSTFIKEFGELRKLSHLRKVKSEKLIEILRQQQYQTTAQPPYPNAARMQRAVARCQLRRYATLREKTRRIDPVELYEPKLEVKRVYPDYDSINVRMQAYDFVPLEKFQSYVHRIARRFNFKVVDSYAVTAQTLKAVTFKPSSTLPDTEVDLSIYERVVRLELVPCVHLPLFVSLIQAHAPVGTTITVKQHEKDDEEARYIPDLLLKQTQEELKALDDPMVRKRLGWE